MKALNERCITLSGNRGKMTFGEIGGQLKQIIEAWEKDEPATITGRIDEKSLFTGKMAQQLRLAADFVCGDEDTDGNPVFGTSKRGIQVSMNDANTEVTVVLSHSPGEITLA